VGALEWRIRWFSTHRVASALVVVITISSIFAFYAINLGLVGQLLVCPGCNLPQMLFVDHYIIQNNTQQRPCLLTIWLRSPGPAGKTETIQALTLSNGQSSYDFATNRIAVTAPSNVSVTVDTSSQGLYFTPGSSYLLGIVTDKADFGTGFSIVYPPETLILQGYTIGFDPGQTNATVLNFTMLNVGSSSARLASLTIRDVTANSNPFNFTMNGPTITQPGSWAQVVLDTHGSGFYFTHQHAYYLTITPSTGASSTSSILFQ
jgi:hypothetical protein